MKCSFCGFEFDEQQAHQGCNGCVMRKNCGKLKCPNCNYEMPKPISLWRRFGWGGSSVNDKPRPDIQVGTLTTLADLRVGQTGVVAGFTAGDNRTIQKLMALGVVPGVSLNLKQTSPAYVLTVGYTQLAVDRDLAQKIQVDPQ